MERSNLFGDRITYGLVVKCPFEKIKDIRDFMEGEDIYIVYDKGSIGKLRIVEEYPPENDGGNSETE
jgi:hypothetical protein